MNRKKKKTKFTKIFEKKKCVSIDSKCSETHRNAKKNFTPMTDFAPSGVAQARAADLSDFLGGLSLG